MSLDDIAKLVGALISVVTLGKIYYDMVLSKKNVLQQDYKIAKEFLEDLTKNSSMHHFAVERGYQAIASDTNIKVSEAEYLISLENPSISLKNYIAGRSYVEVVKNNNNKVVHFKEKYQSSFSRMWRRYFYMLSYLVNAFIAMIPIAFFGVITKSISSSIFTIIVALASFGILALISLKEHFIIVNAEKLVNSQKVLNH